jgi:hypothetical protein
LEAFDDRIERWLLMRYVKVESGQGDWSSNVLDPEPYLRALPTLLSRLPEGARTFASDGDHYDFTSTRCVKDLKIGSIGLREVGHAQLGLIVDFEANRFKHDARLVIRYDDVTRFDVQVASLDEGRIWPESRRLGDLQLDEILPTPSGCSHEVRMTGGVMVVECRDLRAKWV